MSPQNFLYVLPLAWSSSYESPVSYVLLVLCTTSCSAHSLRSVVV